MNEAIRIYLSELESRRISQSRRYQSEYALSLLMRWLEKNGIKEWREVRENHLRAFLVYLQRDYVTVRHEELKRGSIKTWWNCICGFFGWNVIGGRMLHNSTKAIEVPRAESRLPYVPDEVEMMKLIETPDITTEIGMRDRALLELLYATGIRHNEAYRLNLYDVDVRGGCLTVREGKGGRDRIVPITTNACYWINRYLSESRPTLASGKLFSKAGNRYSGNIAIWLSVTGRRFPYETIGEIVRRYAKHSGIRANVHTFRHCYATHLLRNGAGIRHIQKLLGHKSIESTMIYTHLDVEDLRPAIAILNERN